MRPTADSRQLTADSRRLTGVFAASVVLLSAASGPLSAVQIKPVINAEILGGQYYFQGSESAFGALMSLNASPYMQFNDEWSLVPLYSGSYRGTKQVQDLVGGGTLFQDSQDHVISNKVIRSFKNGLKLKAVGAYGIELLRETKDEGWTKGLYDNRRMSGGTEAEWFFKKDQSVRLAYDYYRIHFPNYQSLESQSSDDLGRELASPDVLDNANHALTLGGQFAMPGSGLLEASVSQTFRSYSDQKLVLSSGDLSNEERNDDLMNFSLQGTWPVMVESDRRLFGTLGYGWTHLTSNQNHYEASRAGSGDAFNANFYSYVTQSLTNQWTLMLGEDSWTFRLAGTIARQAYSDRLIQNSVGERGTDTTHVDSAYLSLGASYPIAKGFRVTASTAFGWNDSNNTYTRMYQYHYNSATYLMGFSYVY
jgi:hypothetical protein